MKVKNLLSIVCLIGAISLHSTQSAPMPTDVAEKKIASPKVPMPVKVAPPEEPLMRPEPVQSVHIPPADAKNLFAELAAMPSKDDLSQKGVVEFNDFGLLTEKIPLPGSLQSLVADVTFSGITFLPAPKGYDDGFVMAAVVPKFNTRAEVAVVMLPDGKTGVSVSIGLPTSWKVSDSLAGSAEFASMQFGTPVLVVTNFDHMDFSLGVPLKIGSNVLAPVGFDEVKKQAPELFNKITPFFGNKIRAVFQAAMTDEKSLYSLHLLPSSFKEPKLSVSKFLPTDYVPESLVKSFSNIVLKAPLVSLTSAGKARELAIRGSLEIFGVKVKAVTTLKMTTKDDGKKIDATLRLYLPPDWSFSNTFPDLKDKFDLKFAQAGLILSTMAYEDKALNLDVEPGLNFLADVEFANLPKNDVTEKLKFIFTKLVPRLSVHGIIKKKITESSFELGLPAGDPVPLSDLMDLDTMAIPDDMKDAFKNIAIRKPGVSFSLAAEEQSFTIEGGATFYEQAVDAKLVVVRTSDGFEQSFYLYLPEQWNISEASPALKDVEEVVERPVFVLSTYQFDDKDLKATIHSGLNVIAGVKLVGPLSNIQDFLDKFLKKYVAVEGGDLLLIGVLKRNITESAFKVYIGAQVGLDFEQMKKTGTISSVPLGINKIMIGNLMVGFGVDMSVAFGAGIQLYLASQPKEPVEFRGEVEASPTKTTIMGYMTGMLDPAFGIKWLALGEVGLELDFDYGVMSSTGLPLSGVGFRGKMNLGEGADKMTIDTAGKIEASTADLPDFAFYADAENLKLGHFIWLFAQMAQGNIPVATIPKVEFEKLKLMIIPKPLSIAGKDYNEGIAADVKVDMLGTKGGLEFEVTSLGIHGSGRLDNIKTPIVVLTGPGPDRKYGTEDDGPVLGLDIGLAKQEIFIFGNLEFPALKIKQETNGIISPDGINFKMTTKLLGEFEAELEIQIDRNDILKGFMRGTMKQSALSSLEEALKKAAQSLVDLAKADIEKARAKARADIAAAQEEIRRGAESEKARVKRRIGELEKEIRSIRDECDDAPWYKKTYICPYVGGKLVKPGGELAGLKIYLATLEVAPLAEKIVGVGGDIADVGLDVGIAGSKAVAGMAQGLAAVAGQAINIQEVTFNVAVKDLNSAKLPKVTIKGVFFGKQLEFKDMQFDFANPIDSFKSIAEQLMKLFE